MTVLSKSKLLAYRQCPKRLWLEIHRPGLRDDSAAAGIFQSGHQVGSVARRLYDPAGHGTLIDFAVLGFEAAFTRSASLLENSTAPIFEAGIKAAGALAFADVMLPDPTPTGMAWKMIELKSSASLKSYHHDGIAIQAHIATSAGVRLTHVVLAHIDTSFVYQGDGNYHGLLRENDLTTEAFSRRSEVQAWISGAQAIAALPDEPDIATGPHCQTPFACGFCRYCHRDQVPAPYPLYAIPHLSGRRLSAVVALGISDHREIPDHLLNVRQQRVKHASLTGQPWFDAAGAAADLAPHPPPATFLDFETAAFAVPIWQGSRPYQPIPFQFSLHYLTENGDLHHSTFLDLTGRDPSLAFAEALLAQCGPSGPVFVYNAGFERRIMSDLAIRFPHLAAPLQAIIRRIVDLLPIARNRYYHPSQQGSWSLKNLLPAAIPGLSYNQLPGVQNGAMAVAAYHEAIAPETTAERQKDIEINLLAYCGLDTLALVRIYEFFTGILVT